MASNPWEDRVDRFGPYGFTPLLGPPILFAVIYALLFVVHATITSRTGLWWTCLLSIGCILETVGNALRAYGHFQPIDVNAYIAAQVIVVLSPVFFTATQFNILSQIMTRTGFRLGLLSGQRTLPLFLMIECASLAVQGAGAAIAATNEQAGGSTVQGGNIVVAGLTVQVVGYIVFHTICLDFGRRYWSRLRRPVKIVLAVDFVSAALILLRCCFRVGEMSRGWVGPVTTTEWYYYVFDCTPVSVAVFLLALAHPSRIFACKGLALVNDASVQPDSKLSVPEPHPPIQRSGSALSKSILAARDSPA